MSNPFIDEISKVGAMYGIYFLVQAYGYSDGLNECSTVFTVNEAVVYGFRHLTHFFRPWDGVAWPLTPVLGLLLLLFSIYLPDFLLKNDNKMSLEALRIYFSILATVLVYTLLSALLSAEFAVSLVLDSFIDLPKFPIVLSFSYILATILMAWLFYKIIFTELRWLSIANKSDLPWQNLLAASFIGLILIAVYQGSLFDGIKDRSSGTNNELQRATSLVGPCP